MSSKINLYHILFAVTIITLFSFGYAKYVNNPIDLEVLTYLKNDNPTEKHLLEKNRVQVLFMRERGWFFIIFSVLVLSILLWINLSNRRQKNRLFIGYKYNLKEKLAKRVKEQLEFQERLHIKYEALTANDLLVAEMLVDGLSSKEISSELNISPTSVNTARYRLRKRMELSPETNLLDFLRQI